jgi:hypothetical protein
VTARLGHPGVPILYDFGTDQDELFMVIEHVAGVTIADLPDRCSPACSPASRTCQGCLASLDRQRDQIRPICMRGSRSGSRPANPSYEKHLSRHVLDEPPKLAGWGLQVIGTGTAALNLPVRNFPRMREIANLATAHALSLAVAA